MSIILTNESSYAGEGGETHWWDWTAFIKCKPPDSLEDIKYVEYHLHPTFKNPVRRVRDQEGGFQLKVRGWGVFELRAKVVFKDESRAPLMLNHYLKFEDAN